MPHINVTRTRNTTVAFLVSGQSRTRNHVYGVLMWTEEKKGNSDIFFYLFFYESEISISVGHQSLEELGETELRLIEIHCKGSTVGTMAFFGVYPLCFFKSKVSTAIYPEILEHFNASLC